MRSCFEGVGAALWSWFLVGSEGDVRHWGPILIFSVAEFLSIYTQTSHIQTKQHRESTNMRSSGYMVWKNLFNFVLERSVLAGNGQNAPNVQ